MATTSPADRIATKLLEGIGRRLWGFNPNLMADFVDQRGPLASARWFATHMPKYERIHKHWGSIRTNLVATVISTINGCAYCSRGHAYALHLIYLDETGELFPMDESTMLAMQARPADEVLTAYIEALQAAKLPDEVAVISRTVELIEGAAPTSSKDDDNQRHLIKMFAVLNQCGITAKTGFDEAHDPVNLDLDLRKRYAELTAT